MNRSHKVALIAASACVCFGIVGCNATKGAAKDLHETGENIGRGIDNTGKALTGKDEPETIEQSTPQRMD
jgi:predicted small secreted protein